MDVSGATAALQRVGPAGKRAGDDVAAGVKKGQSGLRELEGSAGGAANSLLNLGRAQLGLAAVKSAAGAVGEEFKRAADYVKTLANDFADLRKAMQELAALKGVSGSNEFTVEQAQKAAKAGMTPAEAAKAQTAFMNAAGAMIGTDEKTGELAEGAKLTEKQGEEYSSRIAAMMKTANVSPELGMKLGGAILQNAEGPQNVDELMKHFATTFNIAQKGNVDLGEMLPQLARIMAHGISAEESAKMFNIVAPAAPGEEGTSTEAAFRAVQSMKNEGMEEFGVKRGQTQMESVKAFSENIMERKKALMEGGMTETKALDELQAMLEEKKAVPDTREARGLVRGFAQQGIRYGGFERFNKVEAETPADFEQREIKKYRESDQGQHEQAKADTELARIERGARFQDVELELERSRKDVVESGELEETGPGTMLARKGRAAWGSVSGVSAEQQIINREALGRLGRRATDVGVENPYDDRTIMGGANAERKAFILPQEAINKELAELLKKIEENTRGKEGKEPAAEKQAGPPLSARPAGGNGMRGA
jgi:hypothetical protein